MFKKKSTLFIICFILIMTVVVGSTLALIIVKSDDILNVFRPQDPTGDLLITKNVSHPYGSAYQIPDTVSFRFKVDLGKELANKTVKTSAGDMTADANGVIYVTVKPGLSVGIYQLPADKVVTVTETNILPGFAPQGGAQKQITIPKRAQASVVYHNVYTPAAAAPNLTLTGTKLLEGRDWQVGDSFTFSLEVKQDQWTELGTRTITYDPQDPNFNTFDFTDLFAGYPFDHPGTYSFRISEKEGIIGGITYDPTVSYVDVTVTDMDMDGKLEITGVNASQNASVAENNGSYDIQVNIRNTYAPKGSAEAYIHIQKLLKDLSGQGLLPEGFTFQLTDAQGKEIAVSQPTGAAGETELKLVFGAIDAGKSFEYSLKEIKGDRVGMTYDQTTHSIRVDVIDNLDGTIRAEIYEVDAEDKRSNACKVSFANTYDPKDATLKIQGTKHLQGRDMEDGEFSFLMYETDSTFKVAANAVPFTAGNSSGSFTFPEQTYSKVGNYYYVVKEDASAKLGGITYDSTVYQITVTVTDQNGVLTAKQVTTDIFGKAKDVAFENTYSALDAVVNILAQKTLTGSQLQKDQFRFLLYEADKNFWCGESAIATATNDDKGVVRFEELTFDKTGTYQYVLVEDPSDQIPGMVYDSTVYGIQIQVTDDGKGQLVAQTTLLLRTEKTQAGKEPVVEWVEVDALRFVNSFNEVATEPTEPVVPPTGDTSNIPLFLILAVISAAVLIGLCSDHVVYRRKKK